MTPPAATAAARHRSSAAPARPAPRTRPQAPRRKPVAVPRPARRPDLPLGARVLGWVQTLPDHRLVDRLIGGRVWIVLIGGLLVGIVTMQLTLLKLNAGIGRAVEQSTVLQQANAALAATDSQLSDPQRVVDLAQQQLGMVTPTQGSPRFISAASGDAGAALANMRVPSPTPAAIPAAATTTTASPTGSAGTITGVSQTATTTSTTGTTATSTPAATTPAPTTGTGATTGAGTTTPAAGGGTSAATAPSTTTAGGAAPQG